MDFTKVVGLCHVIPWKLIPFHGGNVFPSFFFLGLCQLIKWLVEVCRPPNYGIVKSQPQPRYSTIVYKTNIPWYSTNCPEKVRGSKRLPVSDLRGWQHPSFLACLKGLVLICKNLQGIGDDAPFFRCLDQPSMIMFAEEFVMVLNYGITMKVLCSYPQWTCYLVCFKGGKGQIPLHLIQHEGYKCPQLDIFEERSNVEFMFHIQDETMHI